MRKLKMTGVPWQIPGFPFKTRVSPSEPGFPLQIPGFPFSLPGFPFSFPGFPFRWWESTTGDSQNWGGPGGAYRQDSHSLLTPVGSADTYSWNKMCKRHCKL